MMRARLSSFVMLSALVVALGYGARSAYRISTDSFVAPITLSPDSDMVIASKLRLGEVYAQRAKMFAERERIDAELVANRNAVERLEELRSVADGALAWTHAVTAETDRVGQSDLRELAQREENVREMYAKQEAFLVEMEKNVAAGLVGRAEYVRESMTLSQLRLALVDTTRSQLATRLQLSQTRLARRALAKTGGATPTPLMPEMIAQRTQSVHLELEILKLKAEQRALVAKRAAVVQEVDTIDELTSEVRARPIYRAVAEHLDLAFVPYTQMDGIELGAKVHQCTWGLFNCKEVGSVSELLPGEVVLPDPWGAPARGQYAVLRLAESTAGRAKVLRVRGNSDPVSETSASAVATTSRP